TPPDDVPAPTDPAASGPSVTAPGTVSLWQAVRGGRATGPTHELQVRATDATGAVVGTGTLGTARTSDVRHVDGRTTATCTWRYTLTVPAGAPEVTTWAWLHDVEWVEPWRATARTTSLRTAPPRPHLSYCLACR
ncbi:hypothetical protein, partial [Angustibacter aerolatus]